MNKKTRTIVISSLIIIAVLIIVIIVFNRNNKSNNTVIDEPIVETISIGVAGFGEGIKDLKESTNEIVVTVSDITELPQYIIVSTTPEDMDYALYSDNENVLTVNNDGDVTIKNVGTANVYAKFLTNSEVVSNPIIFKVAE